MTDDGAGSPLVPMLRVGMPSSTLCVVFRWEMRTRSVQDGIPTQSVGTSLMTDDGAGSPLVPMLRVGIPSSTLCVVFRWEMRTRSVQDGIPTQSVGTSLKSGT